MNPDKIENSMLTGTEPDKHACPLCGRNLSEAEDDITPEVEEEPGHNFYECACGYRFTKE